MSANFGENLQNMIPMDFNSVKTVPESYAWLKTDDMDSVAIEESIPLVDLNEPEAAKLIGHACETWGIFQLTNHGVPLDLLEEVDSEARKLFCLPLEQKLKVLKSAHGNAGYGVSRISQSLDMKVWYEGFTIKDSSALYDHAKLLWPSDYQHFCDIMEEDEMKMKELVSTLLSLFLTSLDVNDKKISAILSPGGNGFGALQLNSYPPCPNPDQVLGLAPHTDSSLFTILHQGNISGLEVFKEGLGWVVVKPLPGALVVNIGDYFHVLSNARFHNVLHRVALKEVAHRISIAYFHTVKENFPLSPMVLRDEEVPVYRSIMAKDYLEVKLGGKDPKKAFSVTKN